MFGKWFFLVIMILISCKTNKNGASQHQNDSNFLTLLVRDNYGESDSAETLVIRDTKRLKAFYTKINMTRKPGLPIPEIDFSEEMVVIVCSGKTEDSTIPIVSLFEQKKDTTVLEIVQIQDESSKLSNQITYPFSLYKMPVTEKVISFHEKE